MIKTSLFQLRYNVVKHLRFQVFLGQRQLPTPHPIHKNRMIFQNQAVQTHVGNVQGNSLGNIDFHIFHSLLGQGINQIDRDIVKTSFFEIDNILIDVPFRVTAANLLEHAVIEGLYAQRNPIDRRVFKYSNLLLIQVPRIGFNSQLF